MFHYIQIPHHVWGRDIIINQIHFELCLGPHQLVRQISESLAASFTTVFPKQVFLNRLQKMLIFVNYFHQLNKK